MQWETFKVVHEKSYDSSAEEFKARDNFYRNLDAVNAHNAEYAAGRSDYLQTIYSFSDENFDDIVKNRTGLSFPIKLQLQSTISIVIPNTNVASLDFRSFLQPVVNQNPCGDCWAFATTAQVEYLFRKKYNLAIQLSQQYLNSCSKLFGCAYDSTYL